MLEDITMKKYYKIYHYSHTPNIKEIDPNYYGTAVTRGAECKYGKTGLNKSYYYTEDKPESVVASGFTYRYEIYLPYKWKNLIYDIGSDDLNIYSTVKNNLLLRYHRPPYEYELKEGIEQEIQKLGYKGWKNEQHPQLPHVVLLFYKLSTEKPKDNYIAYDWKENKIEKTEKPQSSTLFFNINSNVNSVNKNIIHESKKIVANL
jgi:hypothetical protein